MNLPFIRRFRQRKGGASINSFGGVDRTTSGSLPLGKAREAYNVSLGGGAIENGTGIRRFISPHGLEVKELASDARAVWAYRRYDFDGEFSDERVLVYAEDGNVYEYNVFDPLRTFKRVNGLSFYEVPSAVNYRYNGEDVMIFTTLEGEMYIYNGSTVSVISGVPAITSSTIHYERLFATSRNAVWFSDDFDPANWNMSLTEAGFIEFADERGATLAVVSFLDYLYVFREYGISKISAYGSQEQFSVSNLFTTSGKIYAKSITKCGDRIMFLASDGIYVFDGLSTQRVLNNIQPMIDSENDNACGAFYEGKLYLACRLRFEDDFIEDASAGNNAVVVYNIFTRELEIMRGVCVRGFTSVNTVNKLAVVVGGEAAKRMGELDKSGRYYTAPLFKCWRSGETDFGRADRVKTLRYISLTSRHDCTLRVYSDGIAKAINVKGRATPQRVAVNRRGKLFTLELTAEGDIYLADTVIITATA